MHSSGQQRAYIDRLKASNVNAQSSPKNLTWTSSTDKIKGAKSASLMQCKQRKHRLGRKKAQIREDRESRHQIEETSSSEPETSQTLKSKNREQEQRKPTSRARGDSLAEGFASEAILPRNAWEPLGMLN
jgi:hypothetical protein